MNTPRLSHTFLDFWKIPRQIVSVENGRPARSDAQVKIQMPAHRPGDLVQPHAWGQTRYYTPAPRWSNNGSGNGAAPATVDTETGALRLSFDLDSSVMHLLLERYMNQESDRFLLKFLRWIYYLFKPLIPRHIQVAVRRQSVEKFKRRTFPAWPVDLTVDLLHYQVLRETLALRRPAALPMISFWPDGASYACVLTHDVELQSGFEGIQRLTALERKYGFRSSWNFVPERYTVHQDVLKQLRRDGFEVGVHGLLHDGRLFESYKTFRERAFRINHYARQWGSSGFRSPSNLRDLNWICQDLAFAYDTSCLSSERYGAQPGGSCTVFPFLYNGMVELPVTLQQDFTLLEILKLTPDQTVAHWIETIETIKKVHGMVLINVHPDYMTSEERLSAYEKLLRYLSEESTCWRALPQEAAQWWRDRQASELTWDGTGWRISGPAAGRAQVHTVSLVGDELQILLPEKAGANRA